MGKVGQGDKVREWNYVSLWRCAVWTSPPGLCYSGARSAVSWQPPTVGTFRTWSAFYCSHTFSTQPSDNCQDWQVDIIVWDAPCSTLFPPPFPFTGVRSAEYFPCSILFPPPFYLYRYYLSIPKNSCTSNCISASASQGIQLTGYQRHLLVICLVHLQGLTEILRNSRFIMHQFKYHEAPFLLNIMLSTMENAY